ncbi:MAG: hypothetical protein IKE75_04795 [Bacilli bacterium]|nr:hypothetical protein [Bacilli bacterium]
MEKNKKMILLNTFRPDVFTLSGIEKNVCNDYFIGSKLCKGNFVVYSSQKEFKPNLSRELQNLELNLSDIENALGLEYIYLPQYLRNKINNSRKKGKEEVKETIKLIESDYEKYLNFFKEEELYNVISVFFNLIYDELVKMNKEKGFKITFEYVSHVEPIFVDIKERNSDTLKFSYFLDKTFLRLLKDNNNFGIINNLIKSLGYPYTIDFNLKDLSECQNIRNSFYNLIYTLGQPYFINSNVGDEIHLKNDFLANCLDSFLIIGIFIEMLKKVCYTIDTDKWKEILSLTNLPTTMKKDELGKILIDCLASEYEFISKLTDIKTFNTIVNFKTESRPAVCTNNYLDFYYHYFFNHYKDKNFMKDEELKIVKKKLLKEYDIRAKRNQEKREMYEKLKEKVNNDLPYLRQLYTQRLIDKWDSNH